MSHYREELNLDIESIINCLIERKSPVKPVEFIVSSIKHSPQSVYLLGKSLPEHSVNSIISELCNRFDLHNLPAAAKGIIFCIWQRIRRELIPRTIWIADQSMIDITTLEFVHSYLLPKSMSISWARNIRQLMIKTHTRDDVEIQVYYHIVDRILALIHDGNTIDLKVILPQYIYMKLPTLSGWSLLHYAVSIEYVHATVVTHVIDTLIQSGLSINTLDYMHQTPLHVAATHMNYLAIVKLCESRLIQKNIEDNRGFIPLQCLLLSLSTCKRRKRISGYDERFLIMLKALIPYDDKQSLWELWKQSPSYCSNNNNLTEPTTSYISHYHSSIYYCVCYGNEFIGEAMLQSSFPLKITNMILLQLQAMLYCAMKQQKPKITIFIIQRIVESYCFDSIFQIDSNTNINNNDSTVMSTGSDNQSNQKENPKLKFWYFMNQMITMAIIYDNHFAFEYLVDTLFPLCTHSEEFIRNHILASGIQYCQCFLFFYVAILHNHNHNQVSSAASSPPATATATASYYYLEKLLKKFPYHLIVILLVEQLPVISISPEHYINKDIDPVYWQWIQQYVGHWEKISDVITICTNHYSPLTIACMVGNIGAVEALLKKLYTFRQHAGNSTEFNVSIHQVYLQAMIYALYSNQISVLEQIRNSLGIKDFVTLLLEQGMLVNCIFHLLFV